MEHSNHTFLLIDSLQGCGKAIEQLGSTIDRQHQEIDELMGLLGHIYTMVDVLRELPKRGFLLESKRNQVFDEIQDTISEYF